MELTAVLRWPIRSRGGFHTCHKCGRKLSWEWVWRGIVIKEEHKTPHLPAIFERHKQHDLMVCKVCTPTRIKAQYFFITKAYLKPKEEPRQISAVEHDTAYKHEMNRITADCITAEHIRADQITAGSIYSAGDIIYESGAFPLDAYTPVFNKIPIVVKKKNLTGTTSTGPG